jgi:para-nitrobenzyl esterase
VRRLSLVLLLVPVLCGATAADAGAAVQVRKGVQYGDGSVETAGGRVPLLLDLYRPARRARRARAAVVVIHGGGFRSGTRQDPEVVRIAEGLVSPGVITVSIDYRLARQRPVLSPGWAPLVDRVVPPPGLKPDPYFSRAVVAAADDTLKAIRYLRRHAKRLHVDPTRIGLVGVSAGAITSDHIAYVLDDYGIRQPAIRFVGSLWGGILISAPNGGSASSQLEKGEAALFASHGDRDPTLPVAMSDELVARAREQHVPNEYYRIAGGGHGPPRFFTDLVVGDETPFDRLLDFARAKLRRKR